MVRVNDSYQTRLQEVLSGLIDLPKFGESDWQACGILAQLPCNVGGMHRESGLIYTSPQPTQSQAGNEGRTLSFFEECETYWRPASNKEDLYQQLSQRKYREIPKHHIRSENIQDVKRLEAE